MADRGKYGLVRDAVLDLVEELAVGEAIPPERQLAGDFGVSRMTLRRAIDDLVREGVLVRRQGSGTFVAEPKISQPLTMTSFSEEMRRRGHVAGARTVDLEVVAAGPRLGRRLEISPMARVVRARRLRLADDDPMAIETLHVPAELVPGLTKRRLEGASFYELLEGDYGIVIDHGLQTIEPTVTTEDEAELLGVPVHAPALLFERTSQDRDDRIIEYVRSVYRGDRYKLVVDLQPAPTRTARPLPG